jgi:Ca2+-binding EF-hand superfamily protein
MVESMIRGAGLEPKYPIKISAIQEGMQNARNNWNRGGGPNGPPGASGGNSGSPPGPGGTPANGDSKPAAPAAPLVPGFGVEQKKQAVPGFDVSTKQAATVAASSPAAADAASPAEAPARNPDQLDETIRRHAESILKQNDKDRSGALERDRGEWADVRNAEAIDKDHNGVITLEELTAYYLAENGRHPVKKADAGKKAAAIPNQPDAAPPNSGKTYRILSPTERLPEGLPDWFARNDANGDGQISMSEYTHEWTPEQAAKFAHFDLNGDGIITAEECLQVLKNETKK